MDKTDIPERYAGNMDAFSPTEVAAIRRKHAAVIGCGGLGGYVCQALARFGVGRLTVIDGDVFSAGNLNRQMFAAEDTLGLPKVEVCRRELARINGDVTVTAHNAMLDDANATRLLAGADIVLDCLDNPKTRLVAARACGDGLRVPLVHGAIGGFFGQVANIFPGDRLLEFLYPNPEAKGLEKTLGNPVFIAQAVAAIQCVEALKILAGRSDVLRNAFLHIDLLHTRFETISFA